MQDEKINKKLFKDRKRTNVLRQPEQRLISYLVSRIPKWLTPDGLTFIGIMGSVFILLAFVLAKYLSIYYLFLAPLGFFINWFGDSLDGRIAYYREQPRKWYGFSLDIIMDWLSTVLIGLGYIIYTDPKFVYAGYFLVILYGWSMIIAQLRYKITDVYSIDAGIVGPTEIRVIISLMILAEVFVPGSIDYSVSAIVLILLVINVADTRKLLQLGDQRDAIEREQKLKNP